MIALGYSLNRIQNIEYPVYDYYVVREQTVREKIAQYDWNTEIAYAVMLAESYADPEAVNKNDRHRGCIGSFGLFQIACIHDDPEKLLNADYNIKRAYELYSEQGWTIWGAYTDQRYLAFRG